MGVSLQAIVGNYYRGLRLSPMWWAFCVQKIYIMEIKDLKSKSWFRLLKLLFVFSYAVILLAVGTFAYLTQPQNPNSRPPLSSFLETTKTTPNPVGSEQPDFSKLQ